MQTVVLVVFDEEAEAYSALDDVFALQQAGRLSVMAGATMHRTSEGRIVAHDAREGFSPGGATAAGGLIGALVGALGGPVTLLFGGITGLALGSVADDEKSTEAELLLATAARRIPYGAWVVVAELLEHDRDVLDSAMAAHGGSVYRWPRDLVEDELIAAAEAQEEAARRAEQVMREWRKRRADQTIGDRLLDLRDKVIGRR